MGYLYLSNGNAPSWSSFDRDTPDGAMNGSASEEWSVRHEYFGGTTSQQYDSYAQMAAGSPFSDAWNWVSSEAKNIYSSVYSLVTGNVSAVPLGYFSTLAQTAPNILPGVRFSVPSGLDHDVLALLSGSQWSSGAITYSLPDSRWDYEWINLSANGYRPLNFSAQQAVRYALEGYSPYSGGPKMGLTSVEGITNLSLEYAGTNSGTLQIAGFMPGAIINRSHSYYPGVPVYHGDVWLDRTSSDAPGSSSFMIVLHELGHSLGLKHPHDYGGTLPTMSSAHDSPEYTVMSYGSVIDYPQTYMQYDVAALQELYGADFTTNSGNTVYKWSTSGETFVNGVGQGITAGNKIFLTIWDGGGTDTYDLSNYSSNADIDLAPGGFLRFSPNQLALKSANVTVSGNVYNAFQYHEDPRSLIENAIGGNGHDTIKGNAANNVLTGSGGNDTLTGVAGNDTLDGGAGNDSLLGGAGNDAIYGGDGNDIIYGGAGADYLDGGSGRNTLSYFDAQGGVTVKLWANSASGDIAQGDIISHFQDVSGGAGGDWLEGDSNDNVLDGCGGGDFLLGLGGNDLLLGREGNDTLIADWGTDILEGGSGADLFAIWGTIQHAIINDFKHGEDHIQLATNLFANFDVLKASAVQQGDDVLIARTGLDILLKHVQLSTLAASDFQFV